MFLLALGAALFLAVRAEVAVALLRADTAAFHYLAAGGIRQFPGDLDVQLEKTLERYVRWKGLHALQRFNITHIVIPSQFVFATKLKGINSPDKMTRGVLPGILDT